MIPKRGIVLPNGKNIKSYSAAVAHALHHELGDTHRAIKTAMRWSGASERTVKNWFSGRSGPSGEHLIGLIQHSDYVLEVMLLLAGRPQVTVATKLIRARDQFAEILQRIDRLVIAGRR
jgi:hypothetical protein